MRAAEETGGDLSTMAVLIRRSIAWTVVPSMILQRARIALGLYITSDVVVQSFTREKVRGVIELAFFTYARGDHDCVFCNTREIFDDDIDHLS